MQQYLPGTALFMADTGRSLPKNSFLQLRDISPYKIVNPFPEILYLAGIVLKCFYLEICRSALVSCHGSVYLPDVLPQPHLTCNTSLACLRGEICSRMLSQAAIRFRVFFRADPLAVASLCFKASIASRIF